MSWDASLECPHCKNWTASFNYTSNTNAMIRAAGFPGWPECLDGLPAAEGGELLEQIITALEGAPGRFRQMNPPNGWGDYDRLLGVLRQMQAASAGDTTRIWRVDF